MADVGSGILKGLCGKRASSPVSPLEPFAFINGYAQQISGKGCQAKLGNAGEAGGDAGIKQVVDIKSTIPVKAADVIVRAMNDFLDGLIYQNFFKGIELLQGYRIDDVDFVTRGYLNEAELLGVMVEAVGLGIKDDGP